METHQYTPITFLEGSEPVPCEMYMHLAVFSDERVFHPSELTEKLQIEPTATHYKGDSIRKNLYWKETSWDLETPRRRTFDLGDVYNDLMNMLDGKTHALADYIKDNALDVKIFPVIVVYNTMAKSFFEVLSRPMTWSGLQ
jgi:hypothetical protein